MGQPCEFQVLAGGVPSEGYGHTVFSIDETKYREFSSQKGGAFVC
jgi:hypothetical protein